MTGFFLMLLTIRDSTSVVPIVLCSENISLLSTSFLSAHRIGHHLFLFFFLLSFLDSFFSILSSFSSCCSSSSSARIISYFGSLGGTSSEKRVLLFQISTFCLLYPLCTLALSTLPLPTSWCRHTFKELLLDYIIY